MDAEYAQAFSRGGAGGRALAAITLTLTVAALTLAACGRPSPSPSPLSLAAASDAAVVTAPTAPAAAAQTLSETGSSLMAPLFALWGPAYHARFSQVTIRTTSSSSGTGIDAAAAATADIGASDAYLSPATLAKHPHLVNIPLAVAALMVVYNLPGIGQATHLRLDGKLLARIYAGQITRWDDPAIAAANPGVRLPGTGIALVHRGDDSGSTFLFTSYLNAQDPSGWSGSLIGTTIAWPRQPGELSAAGTDAMISSVKSAPGAIGYVGVSYLSQVRAAGEGEAALGNAAGGYVLPAAGAIRAALASFTNTPASETISLVNGSGAQAYPIVNYEYAIVSTAQTSAVRAQDLRAFLGWAITSGAAQLARVNFQPLPSSVVTLSGAQIAKIKADT
ncbi:MAG TPA: phosphate ABC transporter substrate-binding protein PstS [Streptosporangiaceae bacterium]|nr:phosphate ABC transporter substrate-binding protein PstS [Streptosporangiaceae bacterium]